MPLSPDEPDYLDDLIFGGLPGLIPGGARPARQLAESAPDVFRSYKKVRANIGEGLDWLTSPIKPLVRAAERKSKQITGEGGKQGKEFSLPEEVFYAPAKPAAAGLLAADSLLGEGWETGLASAALGGVLPGGVERAAKIGEQMGKAAPMDVEGAKAAALGKREPEIRAAARGFGGGALEGAASIPTPLDVMTLGLSRHARGGRAALAGAMSALDAAAGGRQALKGVEEGDPLQMGLGVLRAGMGTAGAGINFGRVRDPEPLSKIKWIEDEFMRRVDPTGPERKSKVLTSLMEITSERNRRALLKKAQAGNITPEELAELQGMSDAPETFKSGKEMLTFDPTRFRDLTDEQALLMDRNIDGVIQSMAAPGQHYSLVNGATDSLGAVQGPWVRPVAEAYEMTKRIPLRNFFLKKLAKVTGNPNFIPDVSTAAPNRLGPAAFEAGYHQGTELGYRGSIRRWAMARNAAEIEAMNFAREFVKQNPQLGLKVKDVADSLTKRFQTEARNKMFEELSDLGVDTTRGTDPTAIHASELIKTINLPAPKGPLSKFAGFASLMKELRLAAGVQGINTQTLKAMLAHTLSADNPIEATKNLGLSLRAMLSPRWAQQQVRNPQFGAKMAEFAHEGLHPSGHGQILDPDAKQVFSWFSPKAWKELGVDVWKGMDDGEKMNRIRLFSKRVFEDPTYQAVLPYMKTRMAEQQAAYMMAQGVKRSQAMRQAAENTNNLMGGLNYDALFRPKQTQQLLQALFLAPDHYESQGRVAVGTAKALLDPHNPLGKTYIRAMKNTIGVLGAMQVYNYLLNGKSTWENGPGMELSVKLGKDERGRDRFWRPFGNFTDWVRLPGAILRSVVGDSDLTSIQQALRSRESGPAGLATAFTSNTDWRGQRILKKGDIPTSLKNVAQVTADAIVPQWLTAPADFFTGKSTLEEAILRGAEQPVQYRQPKSSRPSRPKAPARPKRTLR